jgi:cardiolipin synthase (CMP-forming)
MWINASQIPNLLTFSRIALVPVLILVLKDQDYAAALLVFVLAGVSDALDGWVAKRWRCTTRFGAILDPVADKFLLVSSYVMLMLLDHLPFWLVLTVVFRDLIIIGGYLVYTSVVGTVQMQPSRLSKFNTFTQILLVVAVLVHEASGLDYPLLLDALVWLVFATTVASGFHYVGVWGVLAASKPARRGGNKT